MTLSNELLENLLADYKRPEDLVGEHELLKQLTKKLVERALRTEIAEYPGRARNKSTASIVCNSRNGKHKRTLESEFDELLSDIPGNHYSTFTQLTIPGYQVRRSGFDDKIRLLYARGMTAQEIQGHLAEKYGAKVSSVLISTVTDAVIDDVRAWQARSLDSLYPVVYFDCIHVKVRDHGVVVNKTVHMALGVKLSGAKELLGIWVARTEGVRFWLAVLTEFKNRGVQDIFIVCVDRLEGFSEAIETVFSKTTIQLCIVHLVRRSLGCVDWKLRKTVATDLRAIYAATTVTEAEKQLTAFDERWSGSYPAIVRTWRRNWAHIIPYFDYPSEIRHIIYTTNAIEQVNTSLRKISKKRGIFPSDEALLKLFYLALMNINKKWTKPLSL